MSRCGSVFLPISKKEPLTRISSPNGGGCRIISKNKKSERPITLAEALLFRKVYNLKKKNPKHLLFQGVSGFLDYIFDGLY